MLENYIKMAWKVLLRRKLFTFISLFGISFTIFILMIAISYLDHQISPEGPEVKQTRILIAGNMVENNSVQSSVRMGSPSYFFLDKYARTLKTPEMVSVYSNTSKYFTYKDNRKLSFSYKSVDANFWKIFEFNFISGKPFGQREVDNADRFAIISKSTAENYFGSIEAIGKEIDIESKMFKVVGIVPDVSITNNNSYSDIWIPIPFSSDYSITDDYSGDCKAAILAYSENDFHKIKQEYFSNLLVAFKNHSRISEWTGIKSVLKTRFDLLAEEINSTDDDYNVGTTADKTYSEKGGMANKDIVFLAIIAIMFVFMLLPAINLVNINLSRIIERSSEIGVRKAFGASRGALVAQFITENLILTLMGGVISFVLTLTALSIINKSGLIINTELALNFRVFLLSIGVCIIFGFIAGVYPAYKMSKLNPVESLRGGE